MPATTAKIRSKGQNLYSHGSDQCDSPLRVLQDVSLQVPSGGFRFVTGASGAGKTTLLRLMFLGIQPSQGRLEIFGRDTRKLTRDQKALVRSRLGVVFQDFRLIDHKASTTTSPCRCGFRKARKGDRDYVHELLHWVGRASTPMSDPAAQAVRSSGSPSPAR